MASPSPRPRRTGSTAIAQRKGLVPSKSVVSGHKGVKVLRKAVIHKPAHQLYAFCRNLENLARVIEHPVAITARSRVETHWSVSAPPGERPLEWDALIINDTPDNLIAWRSSDASLIANAGTMRFEPAPDNESTEVTVQLEYLPADEAVVRMSAKGSGEEQVGHEIEEALRRLEVLMEADSAPDLGR